MDSKQRLDTFRNDNNINTKGSLSVVIQLTRTVVNYDFPLNPADFQTNGGGQVISLGGANLKRILEEHGISQTLASEGGRTSRGSMGLMFKYVEFLNKWSEEEEVNLTLIEEYWADHIRKYFQNQPFILNGDSSKTIATNINDLLEQAKKRQTQNPGVQYQGAVLQHLVAAKLLLVMPENSFEVHGSSVADAPTLRSGDFVINKTIIHCTTAPVSQLIEKCRANISSGYYPVIITIFDRVVTALNLVIDAGLQGRVEVWDVQQFLSSNVYEHSLFDESKRNTTMASIVTKYNALIDRLETDPSLRIAFDAT